MKKIYFVVATTGLDEDTDWKLSELMSALSQMLAEDAEGGTKGTPRYCQVNENAYGAALRRGDLAGATVVFTSTAQARLAKAAPIASEDHPPARVFILSAKIPQRQVVWLNTDEGAEVLANAIKCG